MFIPRPQVFPAGATDKFFLSFKGGTFDQQTLEEKLSIACFSE